MKDRSNKSRGVHRGLNALCAILACAAAGIAGAAPARCPEGANAVPAKLAGDGAQASVVHSLSPEWDSAEQFRLTWFGGYVNENGRLEQTCCFSSSIDASVGELREIDAKVKRLEFSPARINGEPVKVYVSFTILGMRTPDGVRSELLFNQLLARDRFGIAYTAPQRIGQFPELSASEISVEVETQVGADGKPRDSKVVQWEKGSRQIRRQIVKLMKEQCYIPGMANGKAEAMPYREVIDRNYQELLLY